MDDSTVYETPGKMLTNSGILMLTKEFSQETIMPIVGRIMEYNLMPRELRPEFLTLVINSPGGSVHSCYHLIDVMKSSKIPVHTVGMGLVASCGVLTLMAGAKGHRSVTHNTSTMSHVWSWGSSGNAYALEATQREFELTNKRMMKLYRHCTGKSESYIKKNLLGPHDHWLTPEECLEHGIIDTIKETY